MITGATISLVEKKPALDKLSRKLKLQLTELGS